MVPIDDEKDPDPGQTPTSPASPTSSYDPMLEDYGKPIDRSDLGGTESWSGDSASGPGWDENGSGTAALGKSILASGVANGLSSLFGARAAGGKNLTDLQNEYQMNLPQYKNFQNQAAFRGSILSGLARSLGLDPSLLANMASGPGIPDEAKLKAAGGGGSNFLHGLFGAIGAGLGTVIAPGIGTAIGGSLGSRIG